LPIILFFLIVIVQLTIIPFIAIGAIVPNLLIILLVFFTLKNGQIYGTILGSILGLLYDIVTGGFLGSTMFSLTLSGFVAGYFYSDTRQEFYTTTYFFLLIVFITSFANSFLTLLLSSAEIKLSTSALILEQGVLPSIYTSIISLPILLYNQRRRRI